VKQKTVRYSFLKLGAKKSSMAVSSPVSKDEAKDWNKLDMVLEDRS